jgi:hypothetical protein
MQQNTNKISIFSHQESSCQLLSLLIDPTTYPRNKDDENRIRIITFALLNTNLLSTIKDTFIIICSTIDGPSSASVDMENIIYQLATLYPPYYYNSSSLIAKYKKNSNTQYLTRSALLRMITVELLTQPFLLEHMSSRVVTELVIQLPLKDVLDTVSDFFFRNDTKLDDKDVAGLLMNITEMGDIESGKYLDGVLTEYAKAVQLLLTHLPVSYLVDPSASNNNDLMDQGKRLLPFLHI